MKLSTQPLETSTDGRALIELLATVDGIEDIICFSSDYPHYTMDDFNFAARVLPDEWHRKAFFENGRDVSAARPVGAGEPDDHGRGLMALVDVAGVDQLREGVPMSCWSGVARSCSCRRRDGVRAAQCLPHQTQSFGSGIVRPLIEPGAEPGEITVDRGRRCWPVRGTDGIRLRSGRCVIDPRLRVRAYRTVVDCDRVLIEMTS